MNNDLMFSSESGMWDTPQEVIDDLSIVFDWDLDVCASRPNVCANYYSFEEGRDAFENKWNGLWYCNPPYGRSIGKWIDRGIQQSHEEKSTGVMLVPARTDTKAIQRLMNKSSVIVFIKGRLVFGSDESWLERYYTDLLDPKKTKKQKMAIVKKVGGRRMPYDLTGAMLFEWDEIGNGFDYKEWLEADYLKKDPAPFPSMFCVLGGGLLMNQRIKLSSYGTMVTVE